MAARPLQLFIDSTMLPERAESQFSRMANERAVMLGNTPAWIKSRVVNDIALARARFGDPDFLRWHEARESEAA